jgi:hypothetical protein
MNLQIKENSYHITHYLNKGKIFVRNIFDK